MIYVDIDRKKAAERWGRVAGSWAARVAAVVAAARQAAAAGGGENHQDLKCTVCKLHTATDVRQAGWLAAGLCTADLLPLGPA